MNKPRISLVVSHPIQHFCPQYVSLAKSNDWEFCVFFASTMGVDAYEDKQFHATVQWNNLRLSEFPHTFLNKEPLPSGRTLDAVSLDAELTKYSPDVVIIYGYSQKLQHRARRWAINNNRLIYYISDSESHHSESKLRLVVKGVYLRRYFKHISRVLSVGNANEFYYTKYGVPTIKITRMNFPIDIDCYEAAYEKRDNLRAKIRSDLGYDEQSFVVSVVGKLVAWKRQRDVIAAISRLKGDVSIKLIILGGGPDEDSLRAYASRVAKNEVHFAGFVTPTDLPAYYAASDLYIHPSSYEPHSLAISEAIFMGLPVLVSDSCGSYGPEDDVQPGRNGYVYPMGDIDEMVRQISILVNNPGKRSDFSHESHCIAFDRQVRAHGTFLKNSLTADGYL